MGLFKKKDGTNTKLGGVFKNKAGGKSIFSKIANTVMDVAEFIPVAGAAVKGARMVGKGVKVAKAGAKAVKALKTVSKIRDGARSLSIDQQLPVNNSVIVPDALVNVPESKGLDVYDKGKPAGMFDWFFNMFK